MKIEVNHIDAIGARSTLSFDLSYLGFIKHFAWVGQNYMPTPQKLMRSLGMLLHYRLYLNRNIFNADRFSEPPMLLSDPTEKGHFSNLAGKAIADFLSKKIDGSLFTVNYEAAMRANGHRIRGARPDLIAYSQRSIFALEAKGRGQLNAGNMVQHKAQARSGPLAVHFSVASIAYDIFNNVKCNYHDPYNDNVQYPAGDLQLLSQQYYKGLSEFLNREVFEYRVTVIQKEPFYVVTPRRAWLDKNFKREHFFWMELIYHYGPMLLLPANIRELASMGLSAQTIPFRFEQSGENEQFLYIDADRVGLGLTRW